MTWFLFNVRDDIWLSRIVAVGGDHIAMEKGVPILNGVPAKQTPITGTNELIEQLPASERRYKIRDETNSLLDNVAETTVPKGHVYVTGDNRDNSSDSRAKPEMGGPGMVPVENIVGHAAFRTWTKDWTWLGTPVE